jgi:hypothetical protein
VEYAPEEAADTLSVEDVGPLEDSTIVAGLKVTCGPRGDRVEVKDTVPENPFRLVKVTMTFPDDPGVTVSVEELRAILKSGITIVTVIVAEWVPGEPVPVTVTE